MRYTETMKQGAARDIAVSELGGEHMSFKESELEVRERWGMRPYLKTRSEEAERFKPWTVEELRRAYTEGLRQNSREC